MKAHTHTQRRKYLNDAAICEMAPLKVFHISHFYIYIIYYCDMIFYYYSSIIIIYVWQINIWLLAAECWGKMISIFFFFVLSLRTWLMQCLAIHEFHYLYYYLTHNNNNIYATKITFKTQSDSICFLILRMTDMDMSIVKNIYNIDIPE